MPATYKKEFSQVELYLLLWGPPGGVDGFFFLFSLNKGKGYTAGWEGDQEGEERKRVSGSAGRGPAGPQTPTLGQIEPERPTGS